MANESGAPRLPDAVPPGMAGQARPKAVYAPGPLTYAQLLAETAPPTRRRRGPRPIASLTRALTARMRHQRRHVSAGAVPGR